MIHSGTSARQHFLFWKCKNRLRNEACEIIVYAIVLMFMHHFFLQTMQITTATYKSCQEFSKRVQRQFANNHISLFEPNEVKSRLNHHKSIFLLLKTLRSSYGHSYEYA